MHEHLVYNFISIENLSPKYKVVLTQLTTIEILQIVQEALRSWSGRKAMEDMLAPKKNQAW